MNYVDYHGLVYSFRFLINFIESYYYKSLYYIVYKMLKNFYYRLQEIYESYLNVIQFKKKVKSVLENLRKSKKLTPEIEQSILKTKNLSELDLVVRIFASFCHSVT